MAFVITDEDILREILKHTHRLPSNAVVPENCKSIVRWLCKEKPWREDSRVHIPRKWAREPKDVACLMGLHGWTITKGSVQYGNRPVQGIETDEYGVVLWLSKAVSECVFLIEWAEYLDANGDEAWNEAVSIGGEDEQV